MNKLIIFLSVLILTTSGYSQQNTSLCYTQASFVQADSIENTGPTLTPFSHIGGNFLQSFTGTDNILLQLAGVASTYAIVSTNTDYHVSTYFRDHTAYSSAALPAVVIGSTLPLTAGAFLYLYGKYSSDKRMVAASFSVLQAGLITVSYISLLKAITGRAHPDPNSPLDREETSETFNFGLLRSGIYRGWPSGHVGGAMAVASSLAHFYPEKTCLKYLGYGWVVYTMASVSAFNKGTMHWFSDAIAASLMTYSIGASVGNYYRNAMPEDQERVKFRFLPIVDADYTGVYLGYEF